MRRIYIAYLSLFVFLLCPLSLVSGQGVNEQEMFSLLSLRILKYVEWEGEAKVELGKKIRVGIYDRTRGQGYWEVFSKLCERYPEVYELSNLSNSSEVDQDFDLVFIAGKSKLPLDLLAYLENKPVLVIGEHDEFLEKGGIIRLQISPLKKPEYGINLRQARSSGLRISSRLLQAAVETLR